MVRFLGAELSFLTGLRFILGKMSFMQGEMSLGFGSFFQIRRGMRVGWGGLALGRALIPPVDAPIQFLPDGLQEVVLVWPYERDGKALLAHR